MSRPENCQGERGRRADFSGLRPATIGANMPTITINGKKCDFAPGQTTALVGESGSGKSVTSLTLMRLLPKTAQAQVSGEAVFVTREGRAVDLLALNPSEMRDLLDPKLKKAL